MTTKYVLNKKVRDLDGSIIWHSTKKDIRDTFAEVKQLGEKVNVNNESCFNWHIIQRTIDENNFEVEDIIVYDYEKEGKGLN